MNEYISHNTNMRKQNYGVIGAFWVILKEHPVLASVLWFGFFTVLLGLSFVLGLVPKLEIEEPVVALATTTTTSLQMNDIQEENDAPVRIIIERIGVDTTIVNPESRDLDTLNAALLNGVVHYPGSGDLEDTSNMFLFGHSTGFRVVQNEAFKAFNGLKEVQENDLIRVQSQTKEYVYRVTKLSLVDADNTLVTLSDSHKKLTLSTCNVFGQKQERYVVEADFVGSYDLARP